MPPKQKPNAYYFYMLEWKKQKREEGHHYNNEDAAKFCSEDWNNLPEEEKAMFKEMAKEAKEKDKTDLSKKFNAMGVSYEQQENEERENRQEKIAMENSIHSTLTHASRNIESLKTQIFYLVHANVYCFVGQQQAYIPCEIAISRFCLKEGVMATYHVFPAPFPNGNIPLGYKFQVMQNTDLVHGIPEPSAFTKMEYDYNKIRSDVLNFLKPNGGDEIPPLYTMDMNETNNNCHIDAVRTFFDNVASGSYNKFRVFSLTWLFYKLYDTCQQVAEREFNDHERAFPVEGIAHQQLLRDVYNFSPGLACEFHESGDHYQNCSLSFVKRWVFLICEFCCTALRIELVPGRHCVATAEITIPCAKPKSTQPCSGAIIDSALIGGDKDNNNNSTVDCIQEQAENLEMLQNGDNEELLEPRVLNTQELPHSVLEINAGSAPPPNVRLPISRGRGELLTRALNQQFLPGGLLASDDFPVVGAVDRPGEVSKPSGSGWGRGFMMP